MLRLRTPLAVAGVLAASLLWVHGPAPAQASRPFETAVVKLYSGGKIVGEWEAVGSGRLEGDSFVFPVRSGVQDLEVRIRGTFSFEPKP